MAMAVAYSNFCGQMVHENRGGTAAAYVADTLGSMAAVLKNFTLPFSAEYWPYGEIRTSAGSNPSPWSFVGLLGYFADIVSDTLYVRARHYKPSTAQWLTRDRLWPDEPPIRVCAQ